VVLGSQWGDEGKGKLVDILCQEADVCARCQGGNNAGHTIVANGIKYDFHMLPSGGERAAANRAERTQQRVWNANLRAGVFHTFLAGLVSPSCVNIVGAGVVIHLPALFEELDKLVKKGGCSWRNLVVVVVLPPAFRFVSPHGHGSRTDIKVYHRLPLRAGLDPKNRLFVSNRSHLVFDFHMIVDGLKEAELGRGSIGTTKKGIGPAYSAKASRSGLRVHHLSNMVAFEEKFRVLVQNKVRRYGNFEYDVDKEIERYK
ncbi:MAG: Adenylosuccinate synthetase-domain-containing protein, partial [Olpidium bornovanus]